MTGVKVTVKQKPSQEAISSFLKRSGIKLTDFKGVHKEASILLDQWVQRNFRSEGGNLSTGPWAPFKRGGRWIRGAGLDSSAKLLQDTGRLRASVLPFANSRTAGIGSELPYSKIHDEGAGSVPQRRILPKESEVAGAIIELFERHAEDVANDKV